MKPEKYFQRISVIVLILAIIGICRLLFISNDKKILAEKVADYVKTEYALTPKDINVNISIDGQRTADVAVAESSVIFTVHINAKNEVSSDNYIQRLIEERLSKYAYDKVATKASIQELHVYIMNRILNINTTVTVEDVKNDFPAVLSNLSNWEYSCNVVVDEIDSENTYLVFRQILEYFSPYSIWFKCVGQDGEMIRRYIIYEDFDKVCSKKDLLSALRCVEQRRRGVREILCSD